MGYGMTMRDESHFILIKTELREMRGITVRLCTGKEGG